MLHLRVARAAAGWQTKKPCRRGQGCRLIVNEIRPYPRFSEVMIIGRMMVAAANIARIIAEMGGSSIRGVAGFGRGRRADGEVEVPAEPGRDRNLRLGGSLALPVGRRRVEVETAAVRYLYGRTWKYTRPELRACRLWVENP